MVAPRGTKYVHVWVKYVWEQSLALDVLEHRDASDCGLLYELQVLKSVCSLLELVIT